MTRQLKPQIVDEVSSLNGHVKLPVFFDRNEKDFYVEVTGPEDRVRADSVVEVKKLARELLAKVTEYKWEAIILVEVEQSYDGEYKSPGSFNYRGQKLGARVEFEFDRMERSKHPTREGHFVYRTHEIDFLAKEPDAFSKKLNRHPLANPVLLAILIIAALLRLTGTPYRTYFEGAQFIHFLLGPATVALAFPL